MEETINSCSGKGCSKKPLKNVIVGELVFHFLVKPVKTSLPVFFKNSG